MPLLATMFTKMKTHIQQRSLQERRGIQNKNINKKEIPCLQFPTTTTYLSFGILSEVIKMLV